MATRKNRSANGNANLTLSNFDQPIELGSSGILTGQSWWKRLRISRGVVRRKDENGQGALVHEALDKRQLLDEEGIIIVPTIPSNNLTFSNFALVNDTGTSTTDKITSDIRVTGTLAGSSSNTVKVQFDNESDGTIDSNWNVTIGAPFTYDPRTSNAAFNGYLGPINLKYRAATFSSQGALTSAGYWQTFNYQVAVDPTSTIQMFNQSLNPIADNSGLVNFGITNQNAWLDHTFMVQNSGNATLILGSLQLPNGFSLIGSFPTTIASSASSTFTVRFNATNLGLNSGTLSFSTNAPSIPIFNFTLQADVLALQPTLELRTTSGARPV